MKKTIRKKTKSNRRKRTKNINLRYKRGGAPIFGKGQKVVVVRDLGRQAPLSALRAELAELGFSELRERAINEGVDNSLIVNATDSKESVEALRKRLEETAEAQERIHFVKKGTVGEVLVPSKWADSGLQGERVLRWGDPTKGDITKAGSVPASKGKEVYDPSLWGEEVYTPLLGKNTKVGAGGGWSAVKVRFDTDDGRAETYFLPPNYLKPGHLDVVEEEMTIPRRRDSSSKTLGCFSCGRGRGARKRGPRRIGGGPRKRTQPQRPTNPKSKSKSKIKI